MWIKSNVYLLYYLLVLILEHTGEKEIHEMTLNLLVLLCRIII
nr:MAG TPA: hypothetical protein [Caudoviricetes sp.]